MIDPAKPIRFIDGHGRVRIVGQVGTDFNVRYHDGRAWHTARFTKEGRYIRADRLIVQPIENYEIDFDRPLAFQDTGEHGQLRYFPGTEDFYGVVDLSQTMYWFSPSGMPIARKGGVELATRSIMNIETEATRAADARRRVIEMKVERQKLQEHPLWGMF